MNFLQNIFGLNRPRNNLNINQARNMYRQSLLDDLLKAQAMSKNISPAMNLMGGISGSRIDQQRNMTMPSFATSALNPTNAMNTMARGGALSGGGISGDRGAQIRGGLLGAVNQPQSQSQQGLLGLLGNPLFAIGTALLNPRQSIGQNLQQGFQNVMQQQMYKTEQDRKNRADIMQLALLQNQLKPKPVGSPYKLNTAEGPVLMQKFSDNTTQKLGTPFISKSSVQERFDFLKNNIPQLQNLSDAEAFNMIRSDSNLMSLVSSETGDTNVKVDLRKPPTDKTIKRSLQDKLITTGDAIQRITRISQQFDPTLLEFANQFGAKAFAFGEKLGMNLSSDQQSLIARTEKLATSTLDNLNRTIKDITGAAMTESEAVRIEGTVPSLKDSPTQFKTKINDVLKKLKLAQARTRFILTKGFEYKDDISRVAQNLPLSNFRSVIDKETNKIVEKVAKEAERDGEMFDEKNLTNEQKFRIRQEVINLFGLI